MPDSQNAKPTKKSVSTEEIIKNELPADEILEQEKIDTDQSADETTEEKQFFSDATENTAESERTVGEKATDLAGKVKKGLSQAYEAGAKVVGNLSHAAHEYAEKYKAESEINKLKGENNNVMIQLGQSIYQHHHAGDRFTESFFGKQEIADLFDQIEMLNEKIIETGKQLDTEKNNI